MKLGTLLAAGKSIMKGHVEVSYRASRQVYLPKFGSVKNPFKPETAPASPEIAAPAPAATPAAPRATRAAQGTAIPATVNSLAAIKQKLPALSAMAEKKSMDWAGKFNPASIFRKTTVKGGSKPSDSVVKAPKPGGAQAELSLDSVKVLHNDLTDVDVEIVPMKSRPAAAKPEAPKKSWEFLGEQLFRIEPS
jgi:hypothetical protein